MEKLKILVIDDEVHILELLEYNLIENGYDVKTVNDGEKAIDAILTSQYDLILLDIMLPKISGIDLCKKFRNEYNVSTPIIMLTAKSEEIDKILGLELGADDYITKPFSVRELLARVRAVTRRYERKENNSNIIKIKDLVIDVERHEVLCNGEKIDLTFKEFELLKVLAQNRGIVLTREHLLNTIWGYDYIGETRTVDVHIRYLRKKIQDDDSVYIETIRGVGYKMK